MGTKPAAQATISRYEIVEQVGAGGMGVVYKARDPRLERFVALKFFPPDVAVQRGSRAQAPLLQEAQTIASLDHPNLCTVFEVAEPEAGQLVIVMPYYDGETLRQKVSRGPLPVAEVLEYALQVADGARPRPRRRRRSPRHQARQHRGDAGSPACKDPGLRDRQGSRANTDFTRTGCGAGSRSPT